MSDINLPPLAPVNQPFEDAVLVDRWYSAEETRGYARAAVLADRAEREKDAERLDWFTKIADRGWAPNLVFDDDGRWAVSSAGTAPVPEEGGFKETVSIVSFVDPHEWHNSPRAAIDAAMKESK